jgi:hypothetical protein
MMMMMMMMSENLQQPCREPSLWFKRKPIFLCFYLPFLLTKKESSLLVNCSLEFGSFLAFISFCNSPTNHLPPSYPQAVLVLARFYNKIRVDTLKIPVNP